MHQEDVSCFDTQRSRFKYFKTTSFFIFYYRSLLRHPKDPLYINSPVLFVFIWHHTCHHFPAHSSCMWIKSIPAMPLEFKIKQYNLIVLNSFILNIWYGYSKGSYCSTKICAYNTCNFGLCYLYACNMSFLPEIQLWHHRSTLAEQFWTSSEKHFKTN